MGTSQNTIAWSCFILKRYWVLGAFLLSGASLFWLNASELAARFSESGESLRFLELVRLGTHKTIRGSNTTIDDAPKFFKARTEACTFDSPCTMLAVADMDKQSRVNNGATYKSLLLEGVIFEDQFGEWHVDWMDDVQELFSPMNEGNRGMELSELVFFNERVYTVDDRTGIVFEISMDPQGRFVVNPRHILSEGDGIHSSKGMKLEWATVKDNVLWLGSFGKEYTLPDGTIKNNWPLWVATLDRQHQLKRFDWTPIYNHLRDITGAQAPGYMIHEAVEWSPYYRKWFILPRRWSDETYEAEKDNSMGTNKLIECNESFLECKVTIIGHTNVIKHPRRGYSSVKILPGTTDTKLIAIKSEEEDAIDNKGTMNTYLQVIDIEGNILMDDVKFPVPGKFEGILITSITK